MDQYSHHGTSAAINRRGDAKDHRGQLPDKILYPYHCKDFATLDGLYHALA